MVLENCYALVGKSFSCWNSGWCRYVCTVFLVGPIIFSWMICLSQKVGIFHLGNESFIWEVLKCSSQISDQNHFILCPCGFCGWFVVLKTVSKVHFFSWQTCISCSKYFSLLTILRRTISSHNAVGLNHEVLWSSHMTFIWFAKIG